MSDSFAARYFTNVEFSLYERLVDYEFSDIWSIEDLLEHHDIHTVVPYQGHIPVLNEFLNTSIEHINETLTKDPSVIPPLLLRENKFPRIRQMRDVHQFDVGTHLACCHAFASRGLSLKVLHDLGFSSVVEELNSIRSKDSEYVGKLCISAVLHDLYKAFRPRRALPNKLGDSLSISWELPNGFSSTCEGSDDENVIAAEAIYHWLNLDEKVCQQIRDAFLLSGRMGSMFYKQLKTEEGFVNTENINLNDMFSSSPIGVELAIIDWLGKGWASDIVSTRKGAKKSLNQAVEEVVSEINSSL